jgi:N-methylhydantoinase B/oxoprolinase/acetone carboxylase alpha subunit
MKKDQKVFIKGTDIPRVQIDPVTLQVLGGAFKTLAQEMGLVLYRMSYSSIIRESEDLGAAIIDPLGRQICESESTPMHTGSVPAYVKGFRRRIEEELGQTIDEGDVIIHNNPYYGATHSPDVHIAVPIFYKGRLIAFSALQAHLLDIGAHTPGLCIDALDVWAEARQYTGLKIVEKGKRNKQLWRHILDNVRTPSMNESDMEAMITAAEFGRKRFLELVEEYGLEVILSAAEEWMDYAERMLRAQIAKVPDGTYYVESWLDDDGKNWGIPLKVAVTTTIKGDSVTIDLTGSAKESPTAYNSPFEGCTRTAANYIVRTVFLDEASHDEYIPQNDGMTRALTLIAPEGTIFNPSFPRACFTRFPQINLMSDCVLRSLIEVMPERLCAGTSAHIHFVSYSGFIPEEKQYWVYLEVNEGSYGGRYGKDGMDAVDALNANTRNVPIEETEWHHPLRVERYELRDDFRAPGKWSGGLGIIRETRYLTDGQFTCEGDRHTEAPEGFLGGMGGKGGAIVKNPGMSDEVFWPSKISGASVKKGDVIRIVTPSAGGYYDPFERDPQAVVTDVLDGYADIATTARDFGVVIDRATMTVDLVATGKLRSAHMKAPKGDPRAAEARRTRGGKSAVGVRTIAQ